MRDERWRESVYGDFPFLLAHSGKCCTTCRRSTKQCKLADEYAYPKLRGGEGPRGLEPSQKQSIGVIHIHGIIRSKRVETNVVRGPWGKLGAGGLKQISANVQFLNTNIQLTVSLIKGGIQCPSVSDPKRTLRALSWTNPPHMTVWYDLCLDFRCLPSKFLV